MIFNLLLAAVVVLGLVAPDIGLAVDPWRGHLIVAVMFLMSLTLPAERLRRAAGNVRGLAACTAIGYVALPLACGAAALALPAEATGARAGLVVLGAMPCTLASATVWTRMAAGGEDALALTYTVLSNVASVALVPAYLALFLGAALPVPAGTLLGELALVVLAPVAGGQIVRALLGVRVDRARASIGVIARGLVLLIVLVATSRMAPEVHAAPGGVLLLCAAAAVVHGLALASAEGLSRALGLVRGDRIAVLFAGSQKTLFIGVYIAAGAFPDEPLALLPITAYHMLQLLIDTVLAHRLAAGPVV